MSEYGPVVIFLDDMHVADTMSWQLLVKVVEHIADGSQSLVVVAAMRPDEGAFMPEAQTQQGKQVLT